MDVLYHIDSFELIIVIVRSDFGAKRRGTHETTIQNGFKRSKIFSQTKPNATSQPNPFQSNKRKNRKNNHMQHNTTHKTEMQSLHKQSSMTRSNRSGSSFTSNSNYQQALLICLGVFFVSATLYNSIAYRPSSVEWGGRTTQYPSFYYYRLNDFYAPSLVERYSLEHAVELNYHRNVPSNPKAKHTSAPRGCNMWQPSSKRIYEYLVNFKAEMKDYHENYLGPFLKSPPLEDIRKAGSRNLTAYCQDEYLKTDGMTTTTTLMPYRGGLGSIFTSGSLARSPHGLLEPIYPPFGSLTDICQDKHKMHTHKKKHVPSIDYLVHDFPAMCWTMEARTSKILLFQVGHDISLLENEAISDTATPTGQLLHQFRQFGMPIDTIYTLDSSKSSQKSDLKQYTSSIVQHNLDHDGMDGTSTTATTTTVLPDYTSPTTKRTNHPWDVIQSLATPEDLVLVTLTWPRRGVQPTQEDDLLQELVALGKDGGSVAPLLDQFYIKPNVYMVEDRLDVITSSDGSKATHPTPEWSVQHALYQFQALRNMGIPAHVWVD